MALNENAKMFLRHALLGVLVIVVTPMLAGLISSIITVAILNTVLFLNLTVISIVSAGVVAWAAGMLIKRIKALA